MIVLITQNNLITDVVFRFTKGSCSFIYKDKQYLWKYISKNGWIGIV